MPTAAYSCPRALGVGAGASCGCARTSKLSPRRWDTGRRCWRLGRGAILTASNADGVEFCRRCWRWRAWLPLIWGGLDNIVDAESSLEEVVAVDAAVGALQERWSRCFRDCSCCNVSPGSSFPCVTSWTERTSGGTSQQAWRWTCNAAHRRCRPCEQDGFGRDQGFIRAER